MKVNIKLFNKYNALKEEALEKRREKANELEKALSEYQILLLSDGKTSDVTDREFEDKVKDIKAIKRHIWLLEERILIYHEIVKDLEKK